MRVIVGAIEDSFETAENELGLDHNEIRVHANRPATPPQKDPAHDDNKRCAALIDAKNISEEICLWKHSRENSANIRAIGL